MGCVAKLLAGQGEQLVIGQGRGIHRLDADNALQQIGMAMLQMAQQQGAQIALAMAVAQQQDHVGSSQGLGDLLEIGMVHGRPLPGDVAIVAVAEVLTTGPQTMGLQQRLLDGIAVQTQQPGLAMVEHQHQAQPLIAAGNIRNRFRMLRADAGLAEQMAQPLHGLGIEVALTQTTATGVDPAAGAMVKADLKPLALTLQISPQGQQQGLNRAEPQAMAEGMGPQRLQGAAVVATEFRHRPRSDHG